MIRAFLLGPLVAAAMVAYSVSVTPSEPTTGSRSGLVRTVAAMGRDAPDEATVSSTVPGTLAGGILQVVTFGAIFDGASHPLSSRYQSLAAARTEYPFAQRLSDEIDGLAIHACINQLAEKADGHTGGGTCLLPPGTGVISSTVVVSQANISLAGRGVGIVNHNAVAGGGSTAGTLLRYAGSPGDDVPMVLFTSRPDGPQISNSGITGVGLDCAGRAGIGLQILSDSHSKFDVNVLQYTNIGVAVGTTPTLEWNDTQSNDFWLTTYSNQHTAKFGVVLDGTTAAQNFGNVSANVFHAVAVYTKYGDGLRIGNTDHNVFERVGINRIPGGHLGIGLIFDRGSSPRYGPARFNYFTEYTNSQFGIVARGASEEGGASHDNVITYLDTANGSTAPVIEPGATLCFGTAEQRAVGCIGDSAPAAIANYHDGSAQLGNRVGGGAVDLQTSRSAATQVASGKNSALLGGTGNSAPGTASSVPGGQENTAAGYASEASGISAAATLYGERCRASGIIAPGFVVQNCSQVLRAATSTGDGATLTADGRAPSAANCVNTEGPTAKILDIQLTAVDVTDPSKNYGWTEPDGLLTRSRGPETTAYKGSGNAVANGTGSMAGIKVRASEDKVNGCLNLTFTPPTANTDLWYVGATVSWTEVHR